MEAVTAILSTLNLSDEVRQSLNAAIENVPAQAATHAILNDNVRTLASVLKPQKPAPYNGAIDAVEALNFIESQEEYYSILELDPPKWVRYTVLALNGDAKSWWRSSKLSLTDDWETFRTAFLNAHTPPNAAIAARQNLEKIRQQRLSVAEYTHHFYKQLRLIPDIDKTSTLYLYMNGLEPATSREVKLRQPNSLEDAINLATITYNILHPSTTSISTNTNTTASTAPSVTHNPMAMDVDSLEVMLTQFMNQLSNNKQKHFNNKQQHPNNKNQHANGGLTKLTPAEREYLRKIGACFRCRKVAGHIAKDCHEKLDRSFHNIEANSVPPTSGNE